MKPSPSAKPSLPPSSRGINCYPLLMMMIASWLVDSVFTRNEMERIRRISLWDVIVNATGVPPDAMQRRVFVWQDGDPCPQPFQLNSTLLESCVPLQRYDYFEVIDPGGWGRGSLSFRSCKLSRRNQTFLYGSTIFLPLVLDPSGKSERPARLSHRALRPLPPFSHDPLSASNAI